MKLTKLFFNGKRLKDIYVGASKWQVFKYKLARFIKKAVIVSFLIGIVYGSFQVGRVTTSPVFVQAEDRSNAMFLDRINLLKNSVADTLMKCESAGYSEDDGIVIFDSNAKGSFGQLQFQKSTVIHFYKVLYGKTITPKEAVLIAMDTNKARELAIDIMFKTKNKAGKDWVNCENKYHLDEQIDLIKKMEVM